MGERGTACFNFRVLVRQPRSSYGATLPPPPAYKLRKVSNEMGSKCQIETFNTKDNG